MRSFASSVPRFSLTQGGLFATLPLLDISLYFPANALKNLKRIIVWLLVSRSAQLLPRRLPWHLAEMCGRSKPSFRVTWCPTFKIGCVISMSRPGSHLKLNPSGGLRHMHESDSPCSACVNICGASYIFCMRHIYPNNPFPPELLRCPLFPLNTCPCRVPIPFPLLTPSPDFLFFFLSLNLPFRDMSGCYGNCLRPLPADGGCGPLQQSFS